MDIVAIDIALAAQHQTFGNNVSIDFDVDVEHCVVGSFNVSRHFFVGVWHIAVEVLLQWSLLGADGDSHTRKRRVVYHPGLASACRVW